MPSQKSQSKGRKRSEPSASEGDTMITGSESQNSHKEHIRSDQSQNHKANKPKPHITDIRKISKIDVIEGIEANKIAKNANRISLASVIVNGFILLITAFVGYTAVNRPE